MRKVTATAGQAFDQSALEAVRKFKFDPARSNCATIRSSGATRVRVSPSGRYAPSGSDGRPRQHPPRLAPAGGGPVDARPRGSSSRPHRAATRTKRVVRFDDGPKRARSPPALPRGGAAPRSCPRGLPRCSTRGAARRSAGLRARLQPWITARTWRSSWTACRSTRRESRARPGLLGSPFSDPGDRRAHRLDEGDVRGERRRFRYRRVDELPHGRPRRRELCEARARADDGTRAARRRRTSPRFRGPMEDGRRRGGLSRERPVHSSRGLWPAERLRQAHACPRRAGASSPSS